jgi:hypothetical protein
VGFGNAVIDCFAQPLTKQLHRLIR